MIDSNESVVFSVRMSRHERDAWKAFCKERYGITGARAARMLINEVMDDDLSSVPNAPKILEAARSECSVRTKRLDIYLTESEYDAVEAAAKDSNVSKSKFGVYIVQASLRAEAQPDPAELDLFIRSNSALVSLGRNINRVARKLNQNYLELQAETLEIETLTQIIEGHTTMVSRYINSCADRWKFK